MKILFATGRPFFPDLFGGAERSMHGLLSGLIKHGHDCEGIAMHGNSLQSRIFMLKRLLSGKRLYSSQDQRAGFPIWRTRSWLLQEAFNERMRNNKPDIVLTQLGSAGDIANWSLRNGVRPFVFLRDTEDVPFNQEDTKNKNIKFIANSLFTASWAKEHFSINAPVLYPPIDVSALRLSNSPSYVTLINPVKEKGLDLALSIAKRLPGIHFLFVESWPLSDEQTSYLHDKLKYLKNVTFWKRRINIQTVYDVTKVLIVPSLWYEPFGRVIIEAQACGIPIIGRGVGGIPEAIGKGGLVISESAGADDWAKILDSLLKDRIRMDELREIAVKNAHDGAWNPVKVVDLFEKLIGYHMV